MMQGELSVDVVQPAWSPPKKAGGCRRDPEAGPGTCWYWWEGCPNATKRGCYLRWAAAQAKAGGA